VIDFGRHSILGSQVNAFDYERLLELVIAAAKAKKTYKVGFLASHGLMEAFKSPILRTQINNFDCVAPDGQIVRLALGFLHGIGIPDRVCGPDLTEMLLARAAQENLSIYFFGTDNEKLAKLRSALKSRFPTLKIAGTRAGYYRRASEEERNAIVEDIRKSKADIVLVGLGCPRQEHWIAANAEKIGRPCLGIGAAFDFIAGTLERPPLFVRQLGFEWFARFLQEPRRLFHRYFILGFKFVGLCTLQKLRLLKFSSAMVSDTEAQDLRDVA
jgi:N-acetylglucosaminyldiphosphoundecaprenol N-acetyl-beta-D-mannosaminyltransferase